MRKLRITLALAFVVLSMASFAQVIESGNETTTTENTSNEQKPIRDPIDNVFEKEHLVTNTPITLQSIREEYLHTAHTIWRVLDLREKMNLPLYFPTEPKGNWKSLAQVIFTNIETTSEGNPAPLRIYTDEFVNIPKSNEEVAASRQLKVVYEEKYDPETFEMIGIDTIPYELLSKDLLQYDLKEVWYVDNQRSMMDVRIIAISPVFMYEKESDDGGFGFDDYEDEDDDFDDMPVITPKTLRGLGWIYYPEVRPIMAVNEIFNTKNSARRATIDDIFIQRRFASFIRAEENVYNLREISQYIVNGLDQILESERIKNKIFVDEHDMWEY